MPYLPYIIFLITQNPWRAQERQPITGVFASAIVC